MISIPLAILASLVALYFLSETLNTMTLGGLALAVGILVDDSTVTIENTHRLLSEKSCPKRRCMAQPELPSRPWSPRWQ
jgi:multidrug efflux pump subunit AcrB